MQRDRATRSVSRNNKRDLQAHHLCHSIRHLYHFWPTVLSVEPLVHCVVCLSSVMFLYCGETVRSSEKVSEGVNRKPGSEFIFGVAAIFLLPVSPLYGHQDGRFCLIFACIAQQSVLDGTNGLSSSKPCAYCRIVRRDGYILNVNFCGK